jgi:hypothetical protein
MLGQDFVGSSWRFPVAAYDESGCSLDRSSVCVCVVSMRVLGPPYQLPPLDALSHLEVEVVAGSAPPAPLFCFRQSQPSYLFT